MPITCLLCKTGLNLYFGTGVFSSPRVILEGNQILFSMKVGVYKTSIYYGAQDTGFMDQHVVSRLVSKGLSLALFNQGLS